MKIVSLDGAALNPGDLSWSCFEQFGEITVYPRTIGEAETIQRIADAFGWDKNKVKELQEQVSAYKDRVTSAETATDHIIDSRANGVWSLTSGLN